MRQTMQGLRREAPGVVLVNENHGAAPMAPAEVKTKLTQKELDLGTRGPHSGDALHRDSNPSSPMGSRRSPLRSMLRTPFARWIPSWGMAGIMAIASSAGSDRDVALTRQRHHDKARP